MNISHNVIFKCFDIFLYEGARFELLSMSGMFFLFIFSFFNVYCVSQKPSKPSIFVCLKNSRRSTRGRRRRRSNGGAFAKMLFERQSGLAARPAGCYIIHIYTFAQGAQHPRAWFTSATCRGTLSSVNVLLAHTGVYIQCVQPYNLYGTPLVFHYFVYVFSYCVFLNQFR